MKRHILYSIMFIAIISCRKDRLKNEKDILIGKWEWYKTEIINVGCSRNSKVMTPKSENTTYQIEFEKKGIVTFYQDNVQFEKHRIKFDYWEDGHAIIELDGSKFNIFRIYANEYSLSTYSYFPLKDECGNHESFFIKQ